MDSKRRDYVDPSRGYVRFFHQDFDLRSMPEHGLEELYVRVQIEIDRMNEKLERIALEPVSNPERVIRINKGIRIRRRQLGAIVVERKRREFEEGGPENYLSEAILALTSEEALQPWVGAIIRTRATSLALKGHKASQVVHLPTCSAKARHLSEVAAQEHLDDLVAVGKSDGALAVYPCEECGGWHIGHRSGME